MQIHQRLIVCLLATELMSCAPKETATVEYAGVSFHLPLGATFEPDKDPLDVVTATIHLTDPRLEVHCAIASELGDQKRISAMSKAEQDGIVLFDDTTIAGQECRILGLRIDGDPEKQRLFVNYPRVGLSLSVDAPNAMVLRAALAAIKNLPVEKSKKR